MIKVTKDNTISKVKADVKATVVEDILAYLREKYGTDSVAMVRTGKSDTKTNEIAFIFDTAEVEGQENPVVVTLNPSVKEFATRKTAKKEYEAFDFDLYKQTYDNYIVEKAQKAEDAAKAKADREAKKAAETASRKTEE